MLAFIIAIVIVAIIIWLVSTDKDMAKLIDNSSKDVTEL